MESAEDVVVPSAADAGFFGPFAGWSGISLVGFGNGDSMLAAVADGYVCR